MPRLHLTLVPTDGSPARELPLPHLPASLGRRPDNDIALPLASISGHHLRLEAGPSPESLVLIDLGSTNGTRVNDRRLIPGQPETVHAPTTLQVGTHRLELRATEERYTMTTAASNTELLRQVESLAHQNISRDRTLPCLEILSGPDSGRRLYLPVEAGDLVLGTSERADLYLRLSSAPEELARISFRDARCWIHPLAEAITRDGLPLTESPLASGDRLIIGPMELLFFDPLQDSLAALSGDELTQADETPEQTPVPALDALSRAAPGPAEAPREAPRVEDSPRFSRSESLVILCGVLTILLAVAAIGSFWFFL